MNRFDQTSLEDMSRSELFARGASIAATGTIWIWMVFGVVIIAIKFATSLAGQLNLLETLCITPIVISACVGFVVVSDAAHRRFLAFFGLKPLPSIKSQ
ncbi:hypothetical protein [Burkholderia gladioli]|uniref:hypothetical protein n=1 Tax=Burkholderia gladioli TaxID=28095 RepID=UPI00163E2EF0|nr:hypothetical protein [Burkholderia gladioli]